MVMDYEVVVMLPEVVKEGLLHEMEDTVFEMVEKSDFLNINL